MASCNPKKCSKSYAWYLVFDHRLWKYPFGGNLAPNWYLNYFEYARFNGTVHLFCFRLEISFLSKFGPKNQNCQFKLKFGTQNNSNMQNSMVVFTFSALDQKYSFCVKLA